MRLVYEKGGEPVKLGDRVQLGADNWAEVHYFRPPHKPASSGFVTVKEGGLTNEYYVGIIGAHWIERGNK